MAEFKQRHASTDQQETHPLPAGQGESKERRRRLEEGGGQPLTEQLEDGQLRGVDEEGRHTTGTHGGPSKKGSDNPDHKP